MTAIVQRAATVVTPEPGHSVNVERGELVEEATLIEAMWLKREQGVNGLSLLLPISWWARHELSKATFQEEQKPLSLHSHVSQES